MWAHRCKVPLAAVGLMAILTPWVLANQHHGGTIGNANYTHDSRLASSLSDATGDGASLREHLELPIIYGLLSSRGVYRMAQSTPESSSEGGSPAEMLFWESVKDSQDAADLQAYLDRYPEGIYAVLARNRLRRLTASGEPTAPQLPSSPLSPELVEVGLELSRADRRLIQLGLTAEGFDAGPADGLFGRTTRGAISRWQVSRGEEATGYLDVESARSLQASGGQQEGQEEETGREAAEREQEVPGRQGRVPAQGETEAAPVRPIGPNWIVAENQPCQLHNPNPEDGEMVTWSGGCVDGKASGNGRFDWQISIGTEVYEGWMHDGKMHGQGVMTAPNGFHYEGEWRDGKENGQGTRSYSDGSRYEGEWRDGKRHGQGVWIGTVDDDVNIHYEGKWRGDEWHGQGVMTVKRNDVGFHYEGEFQKGMLQGQGIMTFSNGDRYVGEWRADKENGQGIMSYSDGSRYEGEWRDGQRHGRGSLTYPLGSGYEGEWHEGKRHGQGIRMSISNNGDWVRYEGGWRDGKRHGQGIYTRSDGIRFEGGWRDDKWHGRGIVSYSDGRRFEGEWRNNDRHGRFTYTGPDGSRWEEYRNDIRICAEGTSSAQDPECPSWER